MHGRSADALPRRRLVKLGSRARLSLSQAHESHRPSVLRARESPVIHATAHSHALNRQGELSAPKLGLVRSLEREHNSRHLSATMAPSQPSHAALSKARPCPDATPPTSLLLGICQKASRETESPPSPKHAARFPEGPNFHRMPNPGSASQYIGLAQLCKQPLNVLLSKYPGNDRESLLLG